MPVPVFLCARVAELADARDLGSRVFDVGVQIPSLAPSHISLPVSSPL